jgi:hypothetical protein
MRSRGFFVLALIIAWWLSLGPAPTSLGRPIDLAAPYRVLFEHVPGFSGLRVPARLAMIVVLMISVLGGFGSAWMATKSWGRLALAAAHGGLFSRSDGQSICRQRDESDDKIQPS